VILNRNVKVPRPNLFFLTKEYDFEYKHDIVLEN
jgi:hypothetical protein